MLIRSISCAALCLAAACDTPGRGFMGQPAERVAAGGHVFDVRVRGDRAEAIRLNAAVFPSYGEIGPAAALAIRRATGCEPQALTGDPSVVHATLACAG
ncbi:hypothetical protein [Rhodosalinus sp. K401]|uniref:hypothetical protein n=1 Tax=Rhodosalinus sp. K401 TaxID=3239195 RepID=UPI0035262B33